jgi:hypothetical protein
VNSPKAQYYRDLPLEDGSAPLTTAEGTRASALCLAGQLAEGAAPSPARRLQDELSSRLWDSDVDQDPVAGQWSPRSSLLFILGTGGVFWGLALAAMSLLARR